MLLKILGILFIAMGIIEFYTKKLYSSRGTIDISSNNFYIFYGLLSVGFGCVMLYSSFKSKNTKYIDHSICPNCQESYNYIDLKDGLCPDCNIQTVDIKEYYKNKKNDN